MQAHNLRLLKKNNFCCRFCRMRTILLPIHWIHPRIRKRPTPPTLSTRFSVYVRVVAVRCGTLLQPMLVSGERSFCIKFNWLFLGGVVVLPKLRHQSSYCSIIVIVSAVIVQELRRNKNKYGMFMSNK
ncbi:uncharacterized protein LOC124203138 [Daphnia pulex]|uniref:uncharacterized protein LOC124203138 n=1 Tax=Daphnia pulex TaxID=6669 RepID=UPI001EE022DC|nr:uncharacterized protein LOC124203138 [Daphnia pulex]XP_046455728.1 uncharacterized protein LOC124203138 [Daphnia pulex]